MTPRERFEAVMYGNIPDRVPVMLKIWIDLAAKVMGVPYGEAIGDPELSMDTVVECALRMKMDAVRLFLFPFRRIEQYSGVYYHMSPGGERLGAVDMNGGWTTQFDSAGKVRLESEDTMAFLQNWHVSEPLINGPEDVARMAVPGHTYYEQAGYAGMVDRAVAMAGDRIGCAGNINSATLAFYAPLRGSLQNALIDLYENPGMVTECMMKGVDIAVEKAKFFLNHGVKVLRYNDSIGNMSVISPAQWKRFILPPLREVCDRIHKYDGQARIYCHICGNVLPVLPELAQSGLDCIGPLDPLGNFTVAQARQLLGDRAVLMGGVHTLSFLQDNASQIMRQSGSCMMQGGEYGAFILGSGCAMPRDSRIENMLAAVEAADEYRYMSGRLTRR